MAKKKKKYSGLKKYAYGDWLQANSGGVGGINSYNQQANQQSLSMDGYQGTDFGRGNSESGTQSALSAVNPVVGMANSAVRGVTAPIEEKSLEIDSTTGGYQNKNHLKRGMQAQAFLDPATNIQEAWASDDLTVSEKIGSTLLGGAWHKGKMVEGEDARLKQAFANEQAKRGGQYYRQMEQDKFAQADNSEYNGLSNFAFGGDLAPGSSQGFRKYDGKSHEESKYDGIPVDANGEPSIMSGENPVGLTEGNEVKYTFKDNNTYIFSDKF